jgi:glucan 1,3-beta-glucosidase
MVVSAIFIIFVVVSSSPALYQKYSNNPTPPVDEWTLSLAMAADTASGGLSQLEDHYKTFIVSFLVVF